MSEQDEDQDLPACDPKVFSEGRPVMLVDAYDSAEVLEAWVQQLARVADAPTDWHYSGGIAQVLTLGDVEKVREVAQKLCEDDPLRHSKGPMNIQWNVGPGLYRSGVTPVPDSVVAGYFDPTTGRQSYLHGDAVIVDPQAQKP